LRSVLRLINGWGARLILSFTTTAATTATSAATTTAATTTRGKRSATKHYEHNAQ
jgi:hypothetical protein